MSLRITSTSSGPVGRLTSFGGSGAKTFFINHRRDNTSSSTFFDIRLGAASTYILLTYNASGAIAIYTPSQAPYTNSNNFTHTSGEWVTYAVTIDGSDVMKVYAWDDAGVRTDILTNGSFDRTSNVYSLHAGRSDDNSSAVGEYRYMRYWAAALDTTQLATERTAATAQYTAVTGGDWPLASSTDTADLQDIGALTFGANVATDADEPAYVGAGASAVAGISRHYARMMNG